MKLSIIIPCDNTITHINQLQNVFSSIDNQVAAADWVPETEVIVTYTNPDLRINVSKYPNLIQTIKIYNIPNASIGMLKREGLDKAQGEYVMFLSPYLVFYHHAFVMEMITNLHIDKEVFYYYTISEFSENEQTFLMNSPSLNTFGKVYKKEFLTYYGIDFLDIEANEDLYFSKKVAMNQRNIECFNAPAVIPLSNPNTIDPLTALYTECYSINGANISELIQYQNTIEMNLKNFAYYVYHLCNQNNEHRDMFENMLRSYLNFYLSIYKQLPQLIPVETPKEYTENFETFINRVSKEGIKNE